MCKPAATKLDQTKSEHEQIDLKNGLLKPQYNDIDLVHPTVKSKMSNLKSLSSKETFTIENVRKVGISAVFEEGKSQSLIIYRAPERC